MRQSQRIFILKEGIELQFIIWTEDVKLHFILLGNIKN